MSVSITVDATKAIITLEGRLDYTIGRVFREGYEPLLTNPCLEKIEIDLGAADYVDSAVLGYFLILRERVANTKIEVYFVNSQGVVGTLLRIAGFDHLFSLR